VIDPIDGSLNARRTIPSFAVSIAVASGPTMADVEFGFVHDFGADEEFSACRGEGATLAGEPIEVGEDRQKLELLGIESAEPEWALAALESLAGKVYRLRVVGSLAITGCYVANGRFDAMMSLRPCRSVDVAAAQLIVREAGGLYAFGDGAPEEAELALDARYSVAAAAGERGMEILRESIEGLP
jgi:myo-inositol-1(or 4)-monophosphatase